MRSPPAGERLRTIAALIQPVRRRLHSLLVERDGWVTRDEAAAALDLPRAVVAFHLDKLAEAEVVEVSFERLTARTGPGAGRPSKRYRLVVSELAVSIPDRRYEVAGQLLAAAVSASTTTGAPVEECLHEAARAAGQRMGADVRARMTDAGQSGDQRQAVLAALERNGYEPGTGDGEITLSNCPFHRLAQDHRSLVCGMNLDVLASMVDELGPTPELQAHLAPEAGQCCVRLRARPVVPI